MRLNFSGQDWSTLQAEEALRAALEEPGRQLGQVLLNNNRLRQLPPALSSCGMLTQLYVDANELSELPEWLGSLTQLTLLSVGNNRLQCLPAWLGERNVALERLYVRQNCLTSLPLSLVGLTNLACLWLEGNAGLPAHLRVKTQNVDATQAVLRDLEPEACRAVARRAALTFMLAARRALYLDKNVAKMIGRLIYATRHEAIWKTALVGMSCQTTDAGRHDHDPKPVIDPRRSCIAM